MVVSPITKRQIQADFLTTSYRIVGEVRVGRTGFSGLLNDEASTLLDIFAANMARAHQPTKLVDCYESMSIVKSEILAVCLRRSEDVGPHTLGRGGYAVSSHPIWLTTPVYEITGTLEWAGHLDSSAIMAEGGRGFIPLFDAKLTHILIPATSFECPAMFFNRQYISTLALTKERQKWE
jgi:hypothetical protein